MTLEELIVDLSIDTVNKSYSFPVRVLLPGDAEKVIAALKAGQAMREAYKQNVTGTPVQINREAYEAAKAWDAAFKGDDE